MNLIEHDNQIYEIFDEAITIMLPYQLRNYFAWFILAENMQGTMIWNKYKTQFCDDFYENKEQNSLLHINNIFSLERMCCKDFGLPEPENLENLIHEED